MHSCSTLFNRSRTISSLFSGNYGAMGAIGTGHALPDVAAEADVDREAGAAQLFSQFEGRCRSRVPDGDDRTNSQPRATCNEDRPRSGYKLVALIATRRALLPIGVAFRH